MEVVPAIVIPEGKAAMDELEEFNKADMKAFLKWKQAFEAEKENRPPSLEPREMAAPVTQGGFAGTASATQGGFVPPELMTPEELEAEYYSGPPLPQLYRECKRCFQSFEWDGEEFKTLCPDCYTAIARPCATCDRNIRIDAPSYAKTCARCWIARREHTHTTCPTCPPEKANHLRKPYDMPACKDCLRKNSSYFLQRPGVPKKPLSPKRAPADPLFHTFPGREKRRHLADRGPPTMTIAHLRENALRAQVIQSRRSAF